MNAILTGAEAQTIVSRLNKIDAASPVAVREQTRLIRQSLKKAGRRAEVQARPRKTPITIDVDIFAL